MSAFVQCRVSDCVRDEAMAGDAVSRPISASHDSLGPSAGFHLITDLIAPQESPGSCYASQRVVNFQVTFIWDFSPPLGESASFYIRNLPRYSALSLRILFNPPLVINHVLPRDRTQKPRGQPWLSTLLCRAK